MRLEKIKGVDGIKHLFQETLDNKNKILYVALSDKPLVYLAGDDFADDFMNKRKTLGIFLKSLRFTQENVDSSKHKKYSFYNKEVRVTSKEMFLDDSILIWDDKVAFVNVDKIQGIIITDKKYSDEMKKWFELIWDVSN